MSRTRKAAVHSDCNHNAHACAHLRVGWKDAVVRAIARAAGHGVHVDQELDAVALRSCQPQHGVDGGERGLSERSTGFQGARSERSAARLPTHLPLAQQRVHHPGADRDELLLGVARVRH